MKRKLCPVCKHTLYLNLDNDEWSHLPAQNTTGYRTYNCRYVWKKQIKRLNIR